MILDHVSMAVDRCGCPVPATAATHHPHAICRLLRATAGPPNRPTSCPPPQTASRKVPSGSTLKKAKVVEPVGINGREWPLKIGFTATNELFVGRLAMLGFASSLVGEVSQAGGITLACPGSLHALHLPPHPFPSQRPDLHRLSNPSLQILTSKGALAQFGYEVGLNGIEVDAFIAALIAFNLGAALLPTSETFVPEEQEVVAVRPKGPLQDPTISLLEPQRFFGVGGFGFTKANELFVGRAAQLGFAASLIGEVATGKGPLAQFDIETGTSLANTEYALLAFIGFLFLAAINPGTGKFVKSE